MNTGEKSPARPSQVDGLTARPRVPRSRLETDGGPAPETMVEITGFDAWYGDFHALQDITIEIPDRRVTSFIGPSGCGKSSLLRWINRMNDRIPSARAEGALRIGGEDIFDRSIDVVDLRRRVGMVFQKPNPFPKSIYDNVAFGPRLTHKLSRFQTDELVQRALTQAALWDEVKDRLTDNALELSGGGSSSACASPAPSPPTPRCC